MGVDETTTTPCFHGASSHVMRWFPRQTISVLKDTPSHTQYGSRVVLDSYSSTHSFIPQIPRGFVHVIIVVGSDARSHNSDKIERSEVISSAVHCGVGELATPIFQPYKFLKAVFPSLLKHKNDNWSEIYSMRRLISDKFRFKLSAIRKSAWGSDFRPWNLEAFSKPSVVVSSEWPRCCIQVRGTFEEPRLREYSRWAFARWNN